MDTVEGSRSGPVLLTMLFRCCNFMLVFLLERNTQECVCQVFEGIEKTLGMEAMRELFGVILPDNGSDFKNSNRLQLSIAGERRTWIFYCKNGFMAEGAAGKEPRIDPLHSTQGPSL